MIQSFFKPLYHDAKTLVLDTLFPIYCLACETEGQKFICDECAATLTPLPQQFCIVCQKMSVGGLTHPHCQSPHTADGLISAYDYHDEKISNILITGKYSFLPDVYKLLGSIVADAIKKDFPFLLAPNICYLTPAPLHWMRQRWRGFNQSQVLTESLAKELGLEFADVLTRKKFTKTQKNLKKEQRIKNMESAFILKSPLPPITPLSPLMPINSTAFPAADDTQPRLSPIHNQNFILIDAVTTT